MVEVLNRGQNLNIFRYALGSTIIVVIAMGYNWTLSFLLPVLSLGFLASGKPAPNVKEGLSFFLTIAFASFFGLLLSKVFLPFPAVHILILSLLLFYIFYTEYALFNPMLKTWLLICVLLIPNIALSSKELAQTISISLIVNGGLAILLVWIIFLIFPSQTQRESPDTKAVKLSLSKIQRFYNAITSTLVILPVLLLFYFYNLTSSLLVLIFISILAMQPAFAKDFKAGKALITGNILGGLAAIAAYELFTIIPEFFYFILIVLLTGLLFAKQFFSGKPMAPLWGMGYSTFLLIVSSTTAAGANEADTKVWVRVVQIMLAVFYVVFAFGIISRFKNQPKVKKV